MQLANEIEELRKDLYLLTGETDNRNFLDILGAIYGKCDRRRIHLVSNLFISAADGAFRLGREDVEDDVQGLSLSTEIPGPDVSSSAGKIELSSAIVCQIDKLRSDIVRIYGGESKGDQNLEKLRYFLAQFEESHRLPLLEVFESFILGVTRIRIRVFGNSTLIAPPLTNGETNGVENRNWGRWLEQTRLLGTFQKLYWMLMANRITVIGLQRKEAHRAQTEQRLRESNHQAMQRLRAVENALGTANRNIQIHQERERLLWGHIDKWDDEFDRVDTERNLKPFPQNVNDWLSEHSLPKTAEVSQMHEESELLDRRTRDIMHRGRQLDEKYDRHMAHLDAHIERLRSDLAESPSESVARNGNRWSNRFTTAAFGLTNGRSSASNGHSGSRFATLIPSTGNPSSNPGNGNGASPRNRLPFPQNIRSSSSYSSPYNRNGQSNLQSSQSNPQNGRSSSQNGQSSEQNRLGSSPQNGHSS
ncbi:hypothetical protein L228DRAFT_250899 [Xylona heveae TC161]|uniref:Uncharacterized protein n=1 Tax=Xylona heveae (strain CBS 132557 / TC161) TaxID=1328760 RepID=A0A164ZNK2_XYLHT|nr:hypothetical protein L228DRAFT_250899 [Xylona heveae TC161]KZF19313.1 hypothetical protein L228DRAFT_250899 [Xylona heveae TC161]